MSTTTTTMESVEHFAARADAWLASVAEPRSLLAGTGDDSIAIFPEWERWEVDEIVRSARRFLRDRFDAGFSGIALARSSGGVGLTAAHDVAYELAESSYDLPPSEIWNLGMHMVIPAIDRWGSPELRRRFVEPGLRGEVLFCQLFSEPGAGSDLASLRSRAERIGDEHWLVNGQKVWTSAAQAADYGMLLCRTGEPQERHRGITCLLVPLDAPGVEVRPIRQITGGSVFNEVFLHDVEVADELRLGDVGNGWAITMSTFGSERVSVPIHGPHGSPQRLADLARRLGRSDDPVVRERIADLVIRRRIIDLTLERTHGLLRDGDDLGPLPSMLKLMSTDFLTLLGEVASLLLGPRLTADSGEWGTWVWQRHILESIGLHIGGGTDEIQRNILAERSLGLPRDPRPAPTD